MKKLFASIGFLGFFYANSLFTMQDNNNAQQDPLALMRYGQAFEQEELYRKYRHLMLKYGCGENLFEESRNNEPEQLARPEAEASPTVCIEIPLNYEDDPEFREFEQCCLTKLKNERVSAIMGRAYESILLILFMSGATCTLVEFLGGDSIGANFGVFALFFNSVFFLKDIVSSLYKRAVTPTHPVDTLEVIFARRKCFIPRSAWPIILEKFMVARKNPFSQAEALDFLRFALGLTYYEPKPALVIAEAESSAKIDEMMEKIDDFFTEYEPMEKPDQLNLMKENIRNFILQFYDKKMQKIRPIFLKGPGGLGKTEFAKRLRTWIDEIFPNGGFLFRELVITHVDELEGTQKRPGVMLRLLKDICQAKKEGAVVILDEANWLNEAAFNGPSKRVFDPASCEIQTTYLGAGKEGSGVSLKKPPILMILASNKSIEDENLASRFVNIPFPMPKPEALFSYALKLIGDCDSQLVASENLVRSDHQSELRAMLEAITSFRQVEDAVSILINKWRQDQ